MKKLSKVLAIIAVVALFASLGGAALSEEQGGTGVSIVVKKASGKISVLVPNFVKEVEFVDKEGRDAKMADILADDLNFSGYFTAKRVEAAGKDPAAWSSLDVDYIAQGGYSTDGMEIALSCRLVDARGGSEVMSKRYLDALKVMRQRTHKMADDIIFQLSGEKGISQTKVAFVSDMAGSTELYTADYDGRSALRLTRDENLCLLPSWSPSGNYVTYTSYKNNNPDLWWVGFDGKKKGILSYYPGLNMAASWSPDGQRIAYTLSKDGNSEIYVMRRDGSELKRLTFNVAIDTSPTWSPNGRELAFNSDRSGTPQVYIMDSEGGNVRRITYSGSYNASPAWSPAGDRIAYVSREDGLFNIYLMDVTGGGIVRLTYRQGHNENPSWSPDGKHIVFSSTREAAKGIYEMDADGGNARRLNLPGNCQTPAWSPFMGG